MIPNGHPPRPSFRVGIIGAGIAGLTAAIALRKYYPAHAVEVTIYEQAAQLREIGASIGLNPSGLRVLDKLGVHAALDEAIAFRQPSGWPMIYRHWLTDEEIGHDEVKGQVPERHRMARFHRAHLQRALVDAMPVDVEIKLGMRVQSIKVEEDDDKADASVRLSFEDGSSTAADLVIGADGIHSRARKAFALEHELKWSGMVAFRATFDFALVEDIKGLPDDTVFWVGHERTLFTSRLGKNQYSVVGNYNCNLQDPDAPYRNVKWGDAGDVEFLRSLYQGWNPVVESIVKAVPYTKSYPNMAGTALSSFCFRDRLVLLGDAAHTHGGAFGAGGSLAINDAYALVLALLHVWSPEEGSARPSRRQLHEALRLYEETRKPLVTRLLNIVHGNAQARRWAAEKKKDGGQETDAELRSRIANRPDMSWLSEHDVEAEFEAVVSRYTG